MSVLRDGCPVTDPVRSFVAYQSKKQIDRKGVVNMKKTYEYQTKGTCSRKIHFTVEDGVLHAVSYEGGCNGNLQGIGKLVEGMRVSDVLERLDGIRCGSKPTSCPDQLAQALKQVLKEEQTEEPAEKSAAR